MHPVLGTSTRKSYCDSLNQEEVGMVVLPDVPKFRILVGVEAT